MCQFPRHCQLSGHCMTGKVLGEVGGTHTRRSQAFLMEPVVTLGHMPPSCLRLPLLQMIRSDSFLSNESLSKAAAAGNDHLARNTENGPRLAKL